MIRLSRNLRFETSSVAVVAVLVWGIVLVFRGALDVSAFMTAAAWVGLPTLVALGAMVLLSRWFWRWWPFRTILKTPDLSGRWEGWYFRMRTGEWLHTAQEISQQALDIVPNGWGPDNWSRPLCASIVADAHGTTTELIWSYKTEQTTLNREVGDTHTGTHFLRLSQQGGKRYLEGRYITDRVLADGSSGSGGFIKLVWVPKECKGGLAFSESDWGMPKPTTHPSGTPSNHTLNPTAAKAATG